MAVSYNNIKYDLDFNTGKPTMTITANLINEEIKQKQVKQIFERLYELYTPFEIQQFVEDWASFRTISDLKEEKVKNQIELIQSGFKGLFSAEIKEIYLEYGDFYYNEEERVVEQTNSQYTIVVKEERISSIAHKVTPDIEYKSYKISFDNFMKITGVVNSNNILLTSKHKYIEFLNNITPRNLVSNLSNNSTISALSLSYKDIKSVGYTNLKMTTNVGGLPTGDFKLKIGDREYNSYVKLSADGRPTIYIK
jgi:hypothetical protein